jgi:hypothetical protein
MMIRLIVGDLVGGVINQTTVIQSTPTVMKRKTHLPISHLKEDNGCLTLSTDRSYGPFWGG